MEQLQIEELCSVCNVEEMNIDEISKEHILKLKEAGLKEHILSVQREYVEHTGFY